MMSEDQDREVFAQLFTAVTTAYPDWDARAREEAAKELQDTLEALGEDDDPRSMGWVDDRGRP